MLIYKLIRSLDANKIAWRQPDPQETEMKLVSVRALLHVSGQARVFIRATNQPEAASG